MSLKIPGAKAPKPSRDPLDDWSFAIDNDTGNVYFYNRKTHETRWSLPGSESGNASALISSLSNAHSVIREVRGESRSSQAVKGTENENMIRETIDPLTGRRYYYDLVTRQSYWEDPRKPKSTSVSSAKKPAGPPRTPERIISNSTGENVKQNHSPATNGRMELGRPDGPVSAMQETKHRDDREDDWDDDRDESVEWIASAGTAMNEVENPHKVDKSPPFLSNRTRLAQNSKSGDDHPVSLSDRLAAESRSKDTWSASQENQKTIPVSSLADSRGYPSSSFTDSKDTWSLPRNARESRMDKTADLKQSTSSSVTRDEAPTEVYVHRDETQFDAGQLRLLKRRAAAKRQTSTKTQGSTPDQKLATVSKGRGSRFGAYETDVKVAGVNLSPHRSSVRPTDLSHSKTLASSAAAAVAEVGASISPSKITNRLTTSNATTQSKTSSSTRLNGGATLASSNVATSTPMSTTCLRMSGCQCPACRSGGIDMTSVVTPGSNADLIACSNCGRKFASKSIAKHESVCDKVFSANKKSPQSFVSANESSYKKKPSTSDAKSKPQRVSEGMPKWRKQSHELRMAMQSARRSTSSLPLNESISAPAQQDDDMVTCPHCERRFSEKAAERHIPKCLDIKSKPRTLRKGEGRTVHSARLVSSSNAHEDQARTPRLSSSFAFVSGRVPSSGPSIGDRVIQRACPHCRRQFSVKNFERHVDMCTSQRGSSSISVGSRPGMLMSRSRGGNWTSENRDMDSPRSPISSISSWD